MHIIFFDDLKIPLVMPDCIFTDGVVEDPHLQGIPLLILVNKQDVEVCIICTDTCFILVLY